ncbi:unnamed protein product [Tuwongella immobilis]|uniref:Uncharacterized protein n=1 Tax=Tuwongella immobilis TaxID=692036 RepID=A0A6C2YT51_9BACT|nr:unnamed protein product [Tuwongella immobilis]VTS06509.1 unnamed protein product [Tuwongella immobilis]
MTQQLPITQQLPMNGQIQSPAEWHGWSIRVQTDSITNGLLVLLQDPIDGVQYDEWIENITQLESLIKTRNWVINWSES